VHHIDLLCSVTARPDTLRCVGCCGCLQHGEAADPGGRCVFAPAQGRLTWRGLHTSEHRTRRHA
jgi:hypothetical protein